MQTQVDRFETPIDQLNNMKRIVRSAWMDPEPHDRSVW